MKQSNNQETSRVVNVVDEGIELLKREAYVLQLQRDILALTYEIQELKRALNGDSSTEEAES